LPGENTMLRRSLEQWFEAIGVRPVVRGEFADPGVLKAFGHRCAGVFVIRTAVERETLACYDVRILGRIDSIRERFYAISLERKITHPAVAAITQTARQELFA
jgi:LysR family transcriptional activator of nhaA